MGYYNDEPTTMTLETCWKFGDSHGIYGFCSKIDPRWTEEQTEAYKAGYKKGAADYAEENFLPRSDKPK